MPSKKSRACSTGTPAQSVYILFVFETTKVLKMDERLKE